MLELLIIVNNNQIANISHAFATNAYLNNLHNYYVKYANIDVKTKASNSNTITHKDYLI